VRLPRTFSTNSGARSASWRTCFTDAGTTSQTPPTIAPMRPLITTPTATPRGTFHVVSRHTAWFSATAISAAITVSVMAIRLCTATHTSPAANATTAQIVLTVFTRTCDRGTGTGS
jgi:hypothetical protein